MNDDYLWDKSGTDPETMRLEEALAVFRYRESEPPVLPVAKARATAHWRIALAYAAPAFAVLTLTAGVWLGVSSGHYGDEITFIHHPAAETTAESPKPTEPIAVPSTAPKRPVRPTRHDLVPIKASAPRRSRAKERSPKTVTVAALTKEERQAYEQLLLALSISSSKFKIVHDAINGVEEVESVRTPNHR